MNKRKTAKLDEGQEFVFGKKKGKDFLHKSKKKSSGKSGKNRSDQLGKQAGKKMNKRKTRGPKRSSGKRGPARSARKKQESRDSYERKRKGNEKKEYDKNSLRIIPLGGCEEVGLNMTLFEYQGDIVILDMGIQFPEEDMPGIDYIIPNAKYLEDKKKNIRGVIFSHGHLDHIGAAPILLEKLGNPLIAGRDLTLALIKNRQEDYKKGSAQRLKTTTIKSLEDRIKLGKFNIKFFQTEHSIMDAVGVIIETPEGTVIHPGDWAMERDKKGKPLLDYSHLQKLPKPTVLMLESLGAIHEKHRDNTEEVHKNLQNIIGNAQGRVIIGTFSSQIERIKWVIDEAQKLGKKVALDGYSMKMNMEISQELGYIKINKDTLIDIREIHKHKDSKVIIICTGAQGEENAALPRIMNGEHRFIKMKRSDTIIFSSSVIPGNERTIQRLKDNLYRQCDNVIHGEIMDVHTSGHASQEDILEMLEMVKPNFFIPVHGNHYFLKEAALLAKRNGFPKDNIIVPDNGTVVQFKKGKIKSLKTKVPTDYVFVDGLGVSDTQKIVLRDRQHLAEDGMIVVIATIDTKTGKLVQNPDLISRGFIFLKENRQLIEDLRKNVRKMVTESDPSTWTDTNEIKNTIREKVGQFLFQKTQKRPMVLPVVIEV